MDWSVSRSSKKGAHFLESASLHGDMLDTSQIEMLDTSEIRMMDTAEVKILLDRDKLHDRLDTLYFKIWILTLLFLFYSCLIPMDIRLSEDNILKNIQNIRWTPYIHEGKLESLTDIFSNIVLFMPFGFLTLSLWYRKLRVLGILPAIVCGMLFSAFLEILQLFVTVRTTSITDVCNNTIGTTIGVLIYALFRKQFAKFIFLMFIKEIHGNVLQIYSHSVLVGIFILGLTPYHFNLDIGQIKENIKFILRHTELIPKWGYMQECINNLFLFTLSGFFMSIGHFRKKFSIYDFMYILFINLLMVLVIEFIRIFLMVHSIAIPKIFFASIGICVGVGCGLLYIKSPNLARDSGYFFYLIYFMFLFFNYFYPFQWTNEVQSPPISAYIPFSIYFFNIDPKRLTINFGTAVADMILQIVLFMPIGFWLLSSKKNYIKAFVLGFLCTLLLEICQIFIATRCFDITDSITGGFGCIVGHSLKWRFDTIRSESTTDPWEKNL